MLPTILHATHHWLHPLDILGFSHSLIALVLGGGGVAVHKYLQRSREGRAAMWPVAEAVVQATTVRKRHGYWNVDVSYRYHAQQEYRYGKYRRYFRLNETAESFAAVIRSSRIHVRYREEMPSVSVLVERDLQEIGLGEIAERPRG